MEGKTGRTKGKENTCRTVGITKALADSGQSAARKGFFYFFALKFGYSIETKNPNASPIRKVFGLFVCGRGDKIRTCGLYVPNVALYQTEPHLDGVFLIVFMNQTLKSGTSGERIRPKQSVFSRHLHSIAQKEEFVNLFFCFLKKTIGF